MNTYLCNKKLSCLRCGGCCNIREKVYDDLTEELGSRKQIYDEFKIIYPYSLNRYTINITNNERLNLLKIAKSLNIPLKILPKKIVYLNENLKIIDWFIDSDICPFYDINDGCRIYKSRPSICKQFPKQKKKKKKTYHSDHDFDAAINAADIFLKKYENKAKV